jgi:hypothetical protein
MIRFQKYLGALAGLLLFIALVATPATVHADVHTAHFATAINQLHDHDTLALHEHNTLALHEHNVVALHNHEAAIHEHDAVALHEHDAHEHDANA